MSPTGREIGSRGPSEVTEPFVVVAILCFILLMWLHVLIFKAVLPRRVVLGIRHR